MWQSCLFINIMHATTYIQVLFYLPPCIHPSISSSLPPCLHACLYICMCACMWLRSQQCVCHGDNEYCTLSVVEKAFKLLYMLLNSRLNHAGVITCITPVYRRKPINGSLQDLCSFLWWNSNSLLCSNAHRTSYRAKICIGNMEYRQHLVFRPQVDLGFLMKFCPGS